MSLDHARRKAAALTFAPLRTRVLLVEDHELIRHGLRILMEPEADLEICGETGDEAEARRLVQECQPDVAIIDLKLSPGNGLHLIQWMREHAPACKAIVCTMHDQHLYEERALWAGASGFVNKQLPTSAMIEAIRSVRDNKPYFSEQLMVRVRTQTPSRHASHSVPDSETSPELESLTHRELEVFRLIAQGLSTRSVAEQLHLKMATVETHRERLKAKLGHSTGAELTLHAMHWAAGQATQSCETG